MWIMYLMLGICAVFAALGVVEAPVPIILCVGFAIIALSLWVIYWTASWWLAGQVTRSVFPRLDKLREAVDNSCDDEEICDLLEQILAHLKKSTKTDASGLGSSN